MRHPSSYRDPSGFIFKKDGKVYRQINPVFFDEYNAAVSSGIYNFLFDKKWLVRHKELSSNPSRIVLEPEQLDFITYPYEWSFTQYKHAAQLTLRLQIGLLKNDFCLKDASAFNVTFHKGKAIFIDTLSIERYKANTPWKALKQFNQHFFGPLLLSQYHGSLHLKTLQYSINGMDLNEVKRQLPFFSRFNPTVYSHIYTLSKSDGENDTNHGISNPSVELSKASQIKMLSALEMFIDNMESKENTEWSKYYSVTNYNEKSFEFKKDLIVKWNKELNSKKVIDLGGNDGTFGKELLAQVDQLIVCDIDQPAVDQCYLEHLKNDSNKLTCVVNDLLQPSPAIGFDNQERSSFNSRVIDFAPDLCMALALIHHITLSGNVPFEMSAQYFSQFSKYLIIEFPDREDSWVEFILDSKREARHLFDDYTISAFAKAYQKHFNLIKSEKIVGTARTLFLFERL
ncbi:class I SAM-dependent methyltransferase [uncultured Nonlabens sp.]|uniref:class I SAM-dependent methyltransferase n=1 Tax=uncultured Nonlabens sp. TaxID=859306 RepID=UPI00262852BE|nr:class I SAM-dependent methyltransferase [uncultured Nonlabens sp.]